MHFSQAFIFAALPFLATVKPTLEARQSTSSYSMLAINSGDQVVNKRPIVAADEGFFIGKTSSASCSSSGTTGGSCNAQTQITVDNTTTNLGLTVSVPGGQQIFLTSTGELSYLPPHSHLLPSGAVSGFPTYASSGDSAASGGVRNLGFQGGADSATWLACTYSSGDAVAYKIFANVTEFHVSATSHCHNVAIALVAADPTKAAFQFN